MTAIHLADIADFLSAALEAERYMGDTNGIYRPSDKPIRRLGLALEAWPGLPAWTQRNRVDALFLHRPWRIDDLPEFGKEGSGEVGSLSDVGVLAYHLVFDEHLTTGYNLRLCDALLFENDLAVFGEKEGRPLGMVGSVQAQPFARFEAAVRAVFGGMDETIAPAASDTQVTRVAVVGAMTDELVRAAYREGVQVYITGQLRVPARQAVQDTGMGVLALGHRRSEIWGLRALAGMLRERWADLEVVVAS